MDTIEITKGSDVDVPLKLTRDGEIEPLGLDLPGGDSIKVLFPGTTETIVKTLDNSTSDEVIIDSDPCGSFHAVITEADDLKEGEFQNIVVKIKRDDEDIVREFEKVLKVIDPSLTEP